MVITFIDFSNYQIYENRNIISMMGEISSSYFWAGKVGKNSHRLFSSFWVFMT